jgi:hypothetical protein
MIPDSYGAIATIIPGTHSSGENHTMHHLSVVPCKGIIEIHLLKRQDYHIGL